MPSSNVNRPSFSLLYRGSQGISGRKRRMIS